MRKDDDNDDNDKDEEEGEKKTEKSSEVKVREGGDIGLFIILVPKVL